MPPVVSFVTAFQLNFPGLAKPEAMALHANIDSAGQMVLNQNNGAAYEVARDKFKALLSPADLTDDMMHDKTDALWKYHRRLMSATTSGTFPKLPLRTYLSLVSALQPDETALLGKGMSPGLAKTIGDYCIKGKESIEQAMTQLQLGEPMRDAELKEKLPTFVKLMERSQGPGGRNA